MIELLKSAPIVDWAAFLVILVGIFYNYIERQNRLPAWVRRWLGKIGQENIKAAITYAARLESATSEERRAAAAAYVVHASERLIGTPVPKSIANLLVEFVYQRMKRR